MFRPYSFHGRCYDNEQRVVLAIRGRIDTVDEKIGFVNVRCVDVNQTTTEEQRSTDWMTWQSLPNF